MNAFVMVSCAQDVAADRRHGVAPDEISVWQTVVAAVVGIVLVVHAIRRWR